MTCGKWRPFCPWEYELRRSHWACICSRNGSVTSGMTNPNPHASYKDKLPLKESRNMNWHRSTTEHVQYLKVFKVIDVINSLGLFWGRVNKSSTSHVCPYPSCRHANWRHLINGQISLFNVITKQMNSRLDHDYRFNHCGHASLIHIAMSSQKDSRYHHTQYSIWFAQYCH